jgi:hypothetical protein
VGVGGGMELRKYGWLGGTARGEGGEGEGGGSSSRKGNTLQRPTAAAASLWPPVYSEAIQYIYCTVILTI